MTSTFVYRLACLFLVISLCPLLDGEIEAQQSIEVGDYEIEEVTMPGGRPGNNVNSIVQGPYGFLWFGSHAGVHRYDGYEFVTYGNIEGDSTGLSFPYVESLYWDSEDLLWIGTYGGGLFRFDPATEKGAGQG